MLRVEPGENNPSGQVSVVRRHIASGVGNPRQNARRAHMASAKARQAASSVTGPAPPSPPIPPAPAIPAAPPPPLPATLLPATPPASPALAPEPEPRLQAVATIAKPSMTAREEVERSTMMLFTRRGCDGKRAPRPLEALDELLVWGHRPAVERDRLVTSAIDAREMVPIQHAEAEPQRASGRG
jgi:hypothetical protein